MLTWRPAFPATPRQRALLAIRAAALVTLVIFVTLDLNQPRKGLIKVSQESMERVVQSMAK